MLTTIKRWISGPKNGVSNLKEFGAYINTNKWSLLALLIGILIVLYIIKKVLGLIGSLFGSKD